MIKTKEQRVALACDVLRLLADLYREQLETGGEVQICAAAQEKGSSYEN